ncbi:response regulator transcription factor [Corynebacterium sp. HMSC074C01]|uniref:response regulator transcription factor n=1 Tax=Corynebacterium sp. HMSC074C01 TaxID=1739482 RepID=UPI001FEFBF8E|nr:helix-turn-helix transcriptional regulator [Corynebacterium sp. HMSC074C01]
MFVLSSTASPETAKPHTTPCAIASRRRRKNSVAQLVAKGLDNQEISGQLYVYVTTVKTHIKHILDKIGSTNRVHIAIAVLESR